MNTKNYLHDLKRRPSNIAEQAMRKLCRASTSDDCKRLLQHSTIVPTASNSKICGISRTPDSHHSCGIDATRLLAATNSEEALKILNESAVTNPFTICNEATQLMSTLQMSAIPDSVVDVLFTNTPKDPSSSYGFMHTTTFCQQTFDHSESNGLSGKFSIR